jgi:hypothetical protein
MPSGASTPSAKTTFELVAEKYIQKMEREGRAPATIKLGGERLHPAVRQVRLLRSLEPLTKLLEDVGTLARSSRRHECFPV